MTALREFIKVKNHQIVLNLSDDFLEDEEVEVIVLPKKDNVEDLSFLENEIEKGLKSGISETSHESIIKTLKLKYA